jgi:hypothetical protein
VQIEPIRSHFSQRMWWDRQWDRVRRLGIDKEKQQLMEESRSRWGDRTSNPGGAVRRSQVGSTPILLRHLHASCDDERCQCAEACKRGSGRHGANCSIQGFEPALCGGCCECPFAAVPLPVPTEGQASFNSIVSNSIESRARPPALDAIPHRHTPNLLPLIAGVEIDPFDPMPGCTAR